MIDITQKMFNDWKPFIKSEYWEEFVQIRKYDIENHYGPVIRIENVHSCIDTKEIIEKIYHCEKGGKFILEADRAGTDTLPE